jgi:uncharacterized protein
MLSTPNQNLMGDKTGLFLLLGAVFVVLLAYAGSNGLVPREQTSEISLGNRVNVKLPAIDNNGNGVIANLYVETIHGSNGVLVDINDLIFFADTQESIRTAEKVAENITGIDLSELRLIYTIESNASVIEGESAGAAIAIATIAALENRTLNPEVIITGTIFTDGRIGPVGSIAEKARAAKEAGAKLFLVPNGQAGSGTVERETSCEEIGAFTRCSTDYKNVKIDFETFGIEVREVSNVAEALSHFE